MQLFTLIDNAIIHSYYFYVTRTAQICICVHASLFSIQLQSEKNLLQHKINPDNRNGTKYKPGPENIKQKLI